jgi:hypothetical protein
MVRIRKNDTERQRLRLARVAAPGAKLRATAHASLPQAPRERDRIALRIKDERGEAGAGIRAKSQRELQHHRPQRMRGVQFTKD